MSNILLIVGDTLSVFNPETWEDFITIISEDINSKGKCTILINKGEEICIRKLAEVMEIGEIRNISEELFKELEHLFGDSYGNICFPKEIEIVES